MSTEETKKFVEERDYISSDKAKALFKESTDRIEERINKCFSKEDHATFQTEVKKISLETLGGDDGRKKVKEHATEATKDYIREEAWKNKTFWLPIIISSVATITAIIALLK